MDLWHNGGPARGSNNSFAECSTSSLPYPTVDPEDPTSAPQRNSTCEYEDALFLRFVSDAIKKHDVSKPLFLFWAGTLARTASELEVVVLLSLALTRSFAAHIVHSPLQVPKPFYYAMAAVPDDKRRRYLAMVSFLDAAVKNVTGLLKQKQMWANTLLVFSSDNGGPIYFGGTAGANNYPMRGGKTSNFQGGIRVKYLPLLAYLLVSVPEEVLHC